MMKEAPERIWLDHSMSPVFYVFKPPLGNETEYIRSDIVAEKDARIAELEVQIAGLLNGTQQIEVVLNKCYGGFGLSEKALKLYEHYSGKTNVEYDDIPRHSRHLVRVVKELGDEANKNWSQLSIETITPDSPYEIYEHDGKERIEY